MSLDRQQLRTIFGATAAVSALVTAAGLMIDATWGIRYGIIAALALANWFALSKALGGVLSNNLIDTLIGISLKPLLLVVLLIVAKNGGIEITSFLAGINTFFITLFGYLAIRPWLANGSLNSTGMTTHG